jgi:hypothetical protein
MERGEISLHQVKVFRFVRDTKSWVDNHTIAVGTGVAPRTARLHTKVLTDLGLFDQAEVFPGHRYRISDFAEKRNKGYLRRLEAAAEVFGLG